MAHFSLLAPRSKLNLSSRLFNNTHMNQAQVAPVFSIHWGSSQSFFPHWSKTCDCDFKPYNFQKHFDFPPRLSITPSSPRLGCLLSPPLPAFISISFSACAFGFVSYNPFCISLSVSFCFLYYLLSLTSCSISYHSLPLLLSPTTHFLYYLLPLTSCITSYHSLPHSLCINSYSSLPVLSPTTHLLYYVLLLTFSLAFCIISYHSFPVLSPTTHFLTCSVYYFLPLTFSSPTTHFLYYLPPLTSCIISHHSFPVLSPTTHFLYYLPPLTSCIISHHSFPVLSPTTHLLYLIISHHLLPYLHCVSSPTSHFLYYLPPFTSCIISHHSLPVLSPTTPFLYYLLSHTFCTCSYLHLPLYLFHIHTFIIFLSDKSTY